MIQLWRDLITYTKRIIHDESGDLVKMFSAPKSKSPYEAMTRGSTGGWAKSFAPGEPMGFVGPAATMAAGAIPGVGPLISAGMGAAGTMGGKGSWLGDTGFQGTDYGWGGNFMPTLMGAGMGYLGGMAGRGVSSGVQAMMSPTATVGAGPGAFSVLGSSGGPATGLNAFTGGFGQGVGSYGLGSAGAQSILGGLTAGGAKGGAGGLISQYATPGTTQGIMGTTGTQWGAAAGKSLLTFENLKKVAGVGMLAGSAMMKPPTIGTKPERAMEAVNSPNLVQARDMMKSMAMENPNEFANSAELGEFIDKTVAQSEKAYLNQRKIVENNLAAKGKTLDKSGGAQYIMSEFDKNYQTGIKDFIADTRWSAYQAGINRQVNAVKDYYKISEQEAAMLLQSYGYFDPQDVVNYQSALADYQGMQQMMGTMGGQLLAPTR